jgi:hypothetical protein
MFTMQKIPIQIEKTFACHLFFRSEKEKYHRTAINTILKTIVSETFYRLSSLITSHRR